MKLRVILILLSLLAFMSSATAGYLYYSSSKKTAFREAHRQAVLRVETIRGHLNFQFNEYFKLVRVLAGLKELRRALLVRRQETLQAADHILDHFKKALGVDVCYLMDSEGNTLASSNRNEKDSFVGKNYAFRPYFREAISGRAYLYMALGVTSRKRGIYYSHPVYGKTTQETPLGVVVIKVSIKDIEKEFNQSYGGIVALTDPNSLVFVSNKREWLYHFLMKPSPRDISRVALTRQFGEGPWPWIGLSMKDSTHAVDLSGHEYVFYRKGINHCPGWGIVYLYRAAAVARSVSGPFLKITGIAVLSLCALIGVFVLFLYKKASDHLTQRMAAEEALRESEKTATALLNAPTEAAMLLDTEGTILALNRTAADHLGGTVSQLVGACAFDFFPPEAAEARRSHHDWVVESGKAFQFEDHLDGRWLDNNFYPVFDGKGRVTRVAVFSRDVTDQKTAEEGLRVAKEKLLRYSRELERRVKSRTREITSILKYTPAVVFLKDEAGRYKLVNSRFEELFGVRKENVLGKTDADIFPEDTAERFRSIERKVLERRISTQTEEQFDCRDGIHTYLCIRFPLFNDGDRVSGICGIATDITVLKKAQDHLRKLSASIMAGQEKERTAIARELHDELGQMLTALRIDAVWIRQKTRDISMEVADRAKNMCDLIDKTIDDVRGLSVRLRPGVLDDLGLIPALEWYTRDFEKRTGLSCSFSCHDVPNLDDTLSTAAYRITQEALTNVARHALATRVQVDLRRQDGFLALTITDNGRGFDPKTHSESDCLGIAGMRERANLVGGSLDIQFNSGKGTRVIFRVPVPVRDGASH
ncbi:MAG: PAS domain-containing protein [Deltaproteobacteria bacterium]|nr:PAS domain-containing protein [Deltaproteobacteria bacterium]